MSHLRSGMVREDWHHAANLVENLLLDDPATPAEQAWNLAVKSAARLLCRESGEYPWESDDARRTSVSPEPSDGGGPS